MSGNKDQLFKRICNNRSDIVTTLIFIKIVDHLIVNYTGVMLWVDLSKVSFLIGM